MKFKEYLGKEGAEKLSQRLKEAFENETGAFVFIATANEKGAPKITDAYYKFCKDCVARGLAHTLADADRLGLLAKGAHDHFKNANGDTSFEDEPSSDDLKD